MRKLATALLLATLVAPAAALTPAMAASAVFAVTNADGSPVSCEDALKALRTSATTQHPTDQTKFDELVNKGMDRCNADDDKRADGFFADAFALLK